MTPDLILTGARILTADPARPRVEALAIASGCILAAGDEGDVMALAKAGMLISTEN